MDPNELRDLRAFITTLQQELTTIQSRLDTIHAHLLDAANRLQEHLLTDTDPGLD